MLYLLAWEDVGSTVIKPFSILEQLGDWERRNSGGHSTIALAAHHLSLKLLGPSAFISKLMID
ncbi:hypothetical protein BT96DRAFT_986152 [Gymnopus androsaceus JB14]|uniref:Uncharacterized protein n=1 Tax=Gymnopus androsaceus JB14 TaxID=1447944 RepID=A0A6A4IA64_9AGAR|nr:hypothetical protein BT96DRAFT_986530 [Gymnopus androsaceus JB14]KAE9407922.1 hypothetical protein BT96DRAFT_986152 [Gymnopus androsaceus JB14]